MHPVAPQFIATMIQAALDAGYHVVLEGILDAGRRGLTPLFWTHVAPYGEVKLDMTSRLALGRHEWGGDVRAGRSPIPSRDCATRYGPQSGTPHAR
ncbi:hypothetical protein Acy02nite_91510 [Actinoplanes cyaneus]|uniref:Uncharacterized protein n=1 Tax=Actinoplanes cyaneus TaxID=52696 RepID=A0A919M689_9ACTN|nr:hypothetical protein [Actinoplanes cyaneus]GID71270.1 hypothetical protein Acy02nite_91510 [Actinoplanes cyaneus]